MANWDSLRNESAHDIPEDQYRGIMTSGLLPTNFTLEQIEAGVCYLFADRGNAHYVI